MAIADLSLNCNHCGKPLQNKGISGRSQVDGSVRRYCCYGCLSFGENNTASEKTNPLGWKLGFAVVLAGQSLILGLAVNLTPPAGSARLVLQGAVLMTTAIAAFLLGAPLAQAAWRELRSGRLTVEALFLTTIAGAVTISIQSMIVGRGPIYFEVVGVLLVIYTVNKLLSAYSRSKAMSESQQWIEQLRKVRLVDPQGATIDTEIDNIRRHDLVEVYPGEWIAVDGIVEHGVCFIRDTAITGEPFARAVRPGDSVVAGSVAEDATLRIRVTRDGRQREMDWVLHSIDQLQKAPSGLQRQADRIARYFLPLILIVASSSFVFWLSLVGWEKAIFCSMSVLLVACPCALGLAIPIAIWSTLGRFARAGLVLRQADVIQNLAAVERVAFDKTGTLTSDKFGVVDIVTVQNGPQRQKLIGWLWTVEQRSNHPIARALSCLRSDNIDPISKLDLRSVPGQGIDATFADESGVVHSMQVGRPDWIAADERCRKQLSDKLRTQSGHQIDVAVDGELAAILVVRESTRDSASDCIADLDRLGVKCSIVTGDNAERTREAGFDGAYCEQTPMAKAQLVERWQAKGERCLFVGDGINDAAAIAAADTGIAMSTGTDLAVGVAPATLYSPDLRVIPWAVYESRRTVKRIRGNLLWAATYNVVGIAFAACGLLHPVLAALLMMGSSLFIAYRSSRPNEAVPSAFNAFVHS